MGSYNANKRSMEWKVKTWLAGVKLLEVFARVSPQAGYASLMMSFQKEWKFFHCVTYGVGHIFAPLEAELRDDFIPFLLGSRR